MWFSSDIIGKLDKISELQAKHTTELALYNLSLTEHMKRSDLLEQSQNRMSERILPVENHVLFVNRVIKGALALISTAAAIGAISHYFFK